MVLQQGGGGFKPAVLSKRPYIIGGGYMKTNNAEQEIKELEVRIADLKKRWPAHSLRPAMVKELEELEERLEELKRER